ncbi:MAG: type II secretion system protein GspC [Polyangiaceae bacterium]
MGVDALVRRYRVVVFGGMVAVAALFQAKGVGQLVAARLVPDHAVIGRSKTAVVKTDIQGLKSAGEILKRNPFDSETGPLIDGPAPIASGDHSAKPVQVAAGADPYQDPPCSGIHASLVTATEDPAWSFAAISSTEGEKLRRIGDKIGNFTVHHIGYLTSPDPNHEPVPRVWLAEGSSRCLVEMGAFEPGPSRPVGPTTDPNRPISKKEKQRKELADKVKSKITKVSEGHYIVDKSGVELIIQNYAKLAGNLSARATKDGLKVSGIRDGSILGELGMKNGDRLQTINDFDMADPDKAVDAYAKLRAAGTLKIAATRDGAPYTIDIQIQ